MTSFSASSDECDPNSPTFDRPGDSTAEVSDESEMVCRTSRANSALSDEERERHIKACGDLMELAMVRWYETGDFGHRGEASRWRILMEQAIKGRSAEQIRRMEEARGLA